MVTRLALLLVVAAMAGSQSPLPDSPEHHGKTLAFNRALGVECIHCHNPPSSMAAAKPTYAFAQRMMRMVEGLNAGKLKDLGGITCWTCHRGNLKPARLPRANWEAIRAEHADVFVGPREERALSMSVYAASLGVGCEHCHTVGTWADDSKPQKGIARRMLSLFDEIPTYFESARMPNLQCFLCHQGKVKPERQPHEARGVGKGNPIAPLPTPYSYLPIRARYAASSAPVTRPGLPSPTG